MNVSPAKEAILKKIREALSNPVPLPFPEAGGKMNVFHESPADLDIKFAEEFTKLMGQFAFCVSEAEAFQQLHFLIKKRKWTNLFIEPSLQKFFPDHKSAGITTCDAAVTSCHFLIARTGSIMVSSAMDQGRSASVYAPVHICMAYADQVVYDVSDALKGYREQSGDKWPSAISFITGPSQTEDIERIRITGVHGPGEVFLFLIEKS